MVTGIWIHSKFTHPPHMFWDSVTNKISSTAQLAMRKWWQPKWPKHDNWFWIIIWCLFWKRDFQPARLNLGFENWRGPETFRRLNTLDVHVNLLDWVHVHVTTCNSIAIQCKNQIHWKLGPCQRLLNSKLRNLGRPFLAKKQALSSFVLNQMRFFVVFK